MVCLPRVPTRELNLIPPLACADPRPRPAAARRTGRARPDARREEDLVGREGANERRRAEEHAAAEAITAQGTDEIERMTAQRRADAVRQMEQAKLEAERARAEINSGLGSRLLVALAARELAGQLGKVEHLTITPELLTPLLGKLTASTPEA